MHRLFLLSFLFFPLFNVSAQLNGTYTIGGSNPSYTNILAAASALTTQGIAGNVTFNIRPGTYTERVLILAIPGANANRTVTFQAENGDSSSVLLLNPTATNATNYLFYIQNVGQVVFKKLSFQTPETGDFSSAVILHNAPNVRLENCWFSGSLNASTLNEPQRAIVLVSGTCTNFLAKNCYFRHGFNGLYMTASQNFVNTGVLIERNRFAGMLGEAVYATFSNGIKIQENVVDSCALGFNVRFCSTIVVQRNRLFTHYYGALQFYECFGTAANRCLVANNMVSIFSNTQANGAHIQTCRYLDFFHNSLNVQNGTERAYGIFLSNSSRFIRLQNNCVVVRLGGTPVQLENEPNEIETFSHCNLYNGLIVTDLPPNSVSANPYYTGPTDLHVSNAVLDNIGAPLATVVRDFDGELRSFLTPDIGADEYKAVLQSASVAGFVNPSKDSVYCGDLPLEIYLQNTGSLPLTTVFLTVTFNGVALPPVPWAGNLSAGKIERVTLGPLPLVPLAPNAVSVRCSLPNSGADEFEPDDAFTMTEIFSGLGGVYTIGGANPDFTNFNTAADALKKGGLCDHVTLLIRDGVYNEQLEIFGLKGSSPQRWLTFQGESGDSSKAVLSAPASVNNAFTLRLQNCRYIKLKSLKVQQTGNPNNNSPVFIAFGSDYVIENCLFEGYGAGFGSSSDSETALTAFPDSNLTIRNCQMWGGNMGTRLIGTGPLKYNLVFENNRSYGRNDDCLNAQGWRNVRIRNNEFGAFSSSSLYGIYGLNLYNYEISGNRVAITGVQATNGIYLINCGNYNNDISLVANNVVSMNLGVSNVAVSRGMWIINCDSIELLHNTVCHNSNDLDNFAIDIQQTTGAKVLNNIFANVGLGLAFNTFGVDYSHFDHNVYYTKGALLVYGSTALSGVQAQTGGDQHSVVANPMWTNIVPDSLTLRNPLLENIGIATAIVADIRGFARQLPNPDPGAFETPSLPKVQLGNDLQACGQLLLDGTTPGASNYLWSTGDVSPQLTITASGTYVLTAFNSLGSHSDTINVVISPLPVVFAGDDVTTCVGTTIDLTGATTGTCQWTDLAGNLVTNGCQFATNVTINAAYILTTVDSHQCSASDTVRVVALPLPEVNAGVDLAVCSGSVVNILGASTGICQWTDLAGNLVANDCQLTTNVSTNTAYVLSAEDTNQCTAKDTVVVTALPLPTADAGPDITICSGSSFEISGAGAGACQWTDFNGNVVANGCLFPLVVSATTSYILTVNTVNSCQSRDTMLVTAKPAPTKPVISLNNGVLSVVSNETVQWWLNNLPISGANSPQYQPSATGNYTVQVTNAQGCSVYADLFFFTYVGTTSLSEQAVTVFPNPVVGDRVFVRAAGDFVPMRYETYTSDGRLTMKGLTSFTGNSGVYALPITAEKGVLILKIWDGEGRLVVAKLVRL